MADHPVLWSFRRCPYAMRARLALRSATIQVELREILLRDKPKAFLDTSPSGTVPCLKAGDRVIDESLDIMVWALTQNDPDGWLSMPDAGWDLIKDNDGPFKAALDHTKYATRYPDLDPVAERARAAEFLSRLHDNLAQHPWIFGDRPSLADYAILPFVRQFAFVDRAWFDAQPWPSVTAWLDRFLESPDFAAIMVKYPSWQGGQPPVWFGI
ncbi:MAG: glutathione S-transferase [Pseudomonadota bacterium]